MRNKSDNCSFRNISALFKNDSQFYITARLITYIFSLSSSQKHKERTQENEIHHDFVLMVLFQRNHICRLEYHMFLLSLKSLPCQIARIFW